MSPLLVNLCIIVALITSKHSYINVQAYEYGDFFEILRELELGSELGLSYDYYEESCPQVETIVNDTLQSYLDADITQAAGLLRLHFHDCFVQGCDASLMLVGDGNEQTAKPNLSLRSEAFDIINSIKEKLEEACPNTVSCADILTLAARDSVATAMGPCYPVPLGRKDSLSYANVSVVLASLPAPTFNVSQLIAFFNVVGLNTTDLVALSGGHTIGRAHCSSFVARLDDPVEENLDPTYAEELQELCPLANSTNFTSLDVLTPNVFDNQYYAAVVAKEGLLHSDSVLSLDSETNDTVASFASNQSLFFYHFALSMIKMGSFGVLNSTQGEIRANCSVANPSSNDLDLPTSYSSALISKI